MAAEIPKHVASSVLGSLGRLRESLQPKLEDLINQAATDGLAITESTVRTVLDELRSHLKTVEAEVKKHAPSDV